jgi:hypothetical protein
MSENLNLVKKMGETMANSYSINWELWTPEETKNVENKVNTSLNFYESLFLFLEEFQNQENETDDYYKMIFEETIENLISSYLLKTIIERKQAVEDLVSNI